MRKPLLTEVSQIVNRLVRMVVTVWPTVWPLLEHPFPSPLPKWRLLLSVLMVFGAWWTFQLSPLQSGFAKALPGLAHRAGPRSPQDHSRRRDSHQSSARPGQSGVAQMTTRSPSDHKISLDHSQITPQEHQATPRMPQGLHKGGQSVTRTETECSLLTRKRVSWGWRSN